MTTGMQAITCTQPPLSEKAAQRAQWSGRRSSVSVCLSAPLAWRHSPRTLSCEQDYTNRRTSVSIRYEHETRLEGCCAVIRSSDPVPSFHPCHQSGEDQIPGATHRFCERCPSRRHEYAFDQHRRPAVQHFAERGKMNERVIMLLNDSGSYLIRWEFGDPASPVPRVSFTSFGPCYAVAPHAAVRIRVPLPPRGEQRKVAVLCAEMPSGSPRRFWTEGIGLSILRRLPRSVRMKLRFSDPAVLRVWSDRELSPPGERLTK